MAVYKGRQNNKRKKISKRKKKNLLVPVIIAGVILQTLIAAFVILVIKPYSTENGNGGRGADKAGPFTYEEPGLPHAPVIVEPGDKKLLLDRDAVKPAGEEPDDAEKPLLAIVIDDMGYQLETGKGLLNLDLELSFAFLPSGPYLEKLSRMAARKGRDVLLHVPLEPADSRWDPGPGALFISMNREEMRAMFRKDLAALPQATGVNNHMGSRFTQNREAMALFLEMVQEHKLFFLDSMTSRNSVGYFMAREMGIKTAKRHVFLDNDREKRKIKKQLSHLLDVAGKKGWAIGIGHPYPQTMAALKEMRPEIGRRARLVGVSRMVH
ncbi:MAG: divergent polysaccharide deacetylase family protein [Proteobacteria bacterium]|nr:divergent polysaccharide deacetylase family protein [Pseudomonadota bacterium]MBU1737257.1 divergent polysaccharide deacetylase family protein [Pseudomonadota bacterium]